MLRFRLGDNFQNNLSTVTFPENKVPELTTAVQHYYSSIQGFLQDATSHSIRQSKRVTTTEGIVKEGKQTTVLLFSHSKGGVKKKTGEPILLLLFFFWSVFDLKSI